MHTKDIKKRIIHVRKELNDLLNASKPDYKQVLLLSVQLDKLIVEYYRLGKRHHHRNNSI